LLRVISGQRAVLHVLAFACT